MALYCLFLLPCSPLFFGRKPIALGLVAMNNTVCKGIVSRHHIAVRLSREGKGRGEAFFAFTCLKHLLPLVSRLALFGGKGLGSEDD